MNPSTLITMALEARNKAYVPYSKFYVGAAVLAASGNIYTGCNIENSSFGATNCAERTAIFKAISEGESKLEAIAVVGDYQGEVTGYCAPCGICRQVMTEFSIPEDFVVFLGKTPEDYQRYTLKELLPLIETPSGDPSRAFMSKEKE